MRATLGLLTLLLIAAPAAAQERARPQPATPAREERAPGNDALLHAYQKEYSFLVNEEAALTDRLAELETDHTQRVGAATTELSALEDRLRALEVDAEARRARLTKVDESAGVDDASDVLDAIFSQATTLVPALATETPAGEDAAAPGAGVARVDRALTAVVDALRDRGRVRRTAGSFFLPGGTEAKGELLWIGAVACLGVSPQGAGALAPAGPGTLQLWSAEGAERARAAMAGPLPDVLPLYLFESLDKAVDRPASEGFAAHVSRGGDVAWVIVALGVVTAVLVVVRVGILSLNSGAPDAILTAIAPMLAASNRDQALAYVKARRGSAARVLEAMLPQLGHGVERLESVANERMLRELLRLERFETAVLVAASVAPLLGLLGTVTGMIATFDVITLFGTSDPRLLAAGISEALVATALGLYVAIPALLLGSILSTWTEGLRSNMERAALRMLLIEADTAAAARS